MVAIPLVRLVIILASLVLGVALLVPTAASSATNGTNRPLTGNETSTLTLNTNSFTGSIDGSGQLSHLGNVTIHEDFGNFLISFADNTFTDSGTATFVAANGDKLFTTTTTSGTFTGTVPGISTDKATTVYTIIGGTGRFFGAAGTFTSLTSGLIVVNVGSIIKSANASAISGEISY